MTPKPTRLKRSPLGLLFGHLVGGFYSEGGYCPKQPVGCEGAEAVGEGAGGGALLGVGGPALPDDLPHGAPARCLGRRKRPGEVLRLVRGEG